MPNALNGLPSSMPSMMEPSLPMEPDMGMSKRSPHRVKSKRPPPQMKYDEPSEYSRYDEPSYMKP
jgi:hypothetical protein